MKDTTNFTDNNADTAMDSQTIACRRLIFSILGAAVLDACLPPIGHEGGRREISPHAISALRFWRSSLATLYLEIVGITAKDFLVRLDRTMQSKKHRSYTPTGLDEMSRRNYRWNLLYWENTKNWTGTTTTTAEDEHD
jgi:hypothetical protein